MANNGRRKNAAQQRLLIIVPFTSSFISLCDCRVNSEKNRWRVEASALSAGQRLRSASRNFLRFLLRPSEILMQNRATLRNALRKRNYESPSVSNDMQSSETLRNSLVLNYKSAA